MAVSNDNRVNITTDCQQKLMQYFIQLSNILFIGENKMEIMTSGRRAIRKAISIKPERNIM
jgi:hypothetical protein